MLLDEVASNILTERANINNLYFFSFLTNRYSSTLHLFNKLVVNSTCMFTSPLVVCWGQNEYIPDDIYFRAAIEKKKKQK